MIFKAHFSCPALRLQQLNDAEMMLNTTESNEDLAHIHSLKLMCVYDLGENSAADRERMSFHVNKWCHFNLMSTVESEVDTEMCKLYKEKWNL